jgi:acyl-coenzyme A synthetase/AMP-(fatty) acid ligase
MLFPTPRYGVEAITAIITRANGSIMLVPSTPFPVISEVLAKRSMRTLDFPSIEHFLDSEPAPYQFTKTFEANKHEPLVCLHTSGTTGFPKPVIWTHDWLNSVAEGHYLPVPAGYGRLDDYMLGPRRRVMPLFPAFHASGILCALLFQLLLGTTVVYAPTRLTPNESVDTAADALELLGEEGRIDALALPPPHVEYVGAHAAVLEKLSKMTETIVFGGGDISYGAGNRIAARMQIVNHLASTELGLWNELCKLEADDTEAVEAEWSYIQFHPSLHIRFDPVSEAKHGTLHEAIMVKNQGEGAWVQPIFKIFTEVNEITLGDLFTRHPHDPNKWKHAGRADDLLNFLTGETFHPGNAERRITEHPGIAEAAIVGTRRPKASLIVRLNNGTTLDNVWESIDEINRDSPVYARVERNMILTVTEPFPRTAKGTVQKTATIDLYSKQLDALYEHDGSFVPTV